MRQQVQQLANCLLHAGPLPSNDAIALARRHWLGAWLYHVAGDQITDPSIRRLLATDFAESFTRRAALMQAWRLADTALADFGVRAITLGGLPWSDQTHPHPACKFSQDLDLLISTTDLPRAQAALRAAGFRPKRGHGMWEIMQTQLQPENETGFRFPEDSDPEGASSVPASPKSNREPQQPISHPRHEGSGDVTQLPIPTIELDLHTTPGEEARNPTLRRLYGTTTEQLLTAAEPWTDWRNSSGGDNPQFGAGWRLSIEACMDNRVVHFHKHHCHPLRHGLELLTLLQLPHDPEKLRNWVAIARTGRVWAFVLALLREWGGDELADPITPADRNWAAKPAVAKLLAPAANGQLTPLAHQLHLKMLGPTGKLRYLWGIAWPPRDVLLWSYGHHGAEMGMMKIARLRIRRLLRFAAGGRGK